MRIAPISQRDAKFPAIKQAKAELDIYLCENPVAGG
jgi:hypothetical protein